MWTTSSSSVATVSSAGTVTSGANGTATITATSESASATATVTVQDPPQITTTSLPGVLVNSSYNQTLTQFGGDSPSTWSVITGSLPRGLSLSPSNGRITGTATTVGSSTFTLQVRDTAGQTVSREFTVSVYAPLVITTASVPTNAVVGDEYSHSFGAFGGDGNYTWSISIGSLPGGLSLSLDGILSGTPTAVESAFFYVTVTSGDGQSNTSSSFQIDVYDPLEIIEPSPLRRGWVGLTLAREVTSAGAAYPYTWSISSGSLPDGLYIIPPNTIYYALIFGTPETAGTSTFTMRVTSKGQTAEKEFTITIDPYPW